jgi:TolB-like protein
MSSQEAGQRLYVDAVLAGSVRRVDRKVRVNAQLIWTADDQVLRAEGGLEFEGRDLLETEDAGICDCDAVARSHARAADRADAAEGSR